MSSPKSHRGVSGEVVSRKDWVAELQSRTFSQLDIYFIFVLFCKLGLFFFKQRLKFFITKNKSILFGNLICMSDIDSE